MKYLFLLFPALVLLTACNDDVKTKEWYIQHADVREKRVLECQNDASIGVTPDCKNALAAHSHVAVFGDY